MTTPDHAPPSAVLISHPTHDFGGTDAPPFAPVDHPMTPFAKNCHALLNVLADRLLVNTEEKRRGVEDLGSEIIGQLDYYQRWSVSAAKILNEKGLVTTAELGRRMAVVRERLTADLA